MFVEIKIIKTVQINDSFLFSKASELALGPTLPPIQWVPGGKTDVAWD